MSSLKKLEHRVYRVGIIVETANNGQEAVTMVKRYPFDAVVMDVNMPVMDGLQATRLMRQEERLQTIPIIAMTTHSQPEEIRRCLDSGMSAQMDKPIRPERLYGTLSKLIVEIVIPNPILPLFENDSDEIQAITGIDVNDGLQRFAGNHKLFRRLLTYFCLQHGETKNKIHQALQDGQYSLLDTLLHTIKIFASHIGAISLVNATVIFEQALAGGVEEDIKAAKSTFSYRLDAIIDGLGGLGRDVSGMVGSLVAGGDSGDLQHERGVLGPLLYGLAAHCKNSSIGYGALLNSMQKLFNSTKTALLFAELKRQLDEYHFFEALDVLRKIAAPLDIDLSKDHELILPDSRAAVLIVDDQRSNIDLLKDILTGFNLFVALNGRQALDVANSPYPPQIILLDIMMPEMNGYEVCRRLKADKVTEGIPVIFVTAKKEVADEAEGFAVGGVDYITKPFNAEIIKHRVTSCLELQQHKNELEKLVESRTLELAAAKEAAEAGNRAKSDFLAHMSHEIRTPLNAILGMGEMLLETEMSQKQSQFLQTSQRASHALHALVNNILDLSKIEAGQLILEESPFILGQTIHDILDIQKNFALEKGVELAEEIAVDLPYTVMGDADRIKQVLLNLLNNAIKFTKQGQVTLSVAAAAENMYEFVVSDTGIGMTPEEVEQIFNPFVQADASTTRKFGGTGLGLAICKRLVAAMHGTLQVTSTPNQGSRFVVAIPLPTVELEPEKEAAVTKLATVTTNTSTTPAEEAAQAKTILLVDDTPQNIMILKAFFGHTPHTILIAENGQEALDLFKKHDFDIVLMDMLMPVLDGYAATMQIREWERANNLPATPILALTAQAMQEDRTRAMEAGCTSHLTKPIRKKRLLDTVNGYLYGAGTKQA